MTKIIPVTVTMAFWVAIAALGMFAASDAALAKSGKQYQVKEYKFDKAMHGYDGHAAGGYYCSYVRIPDRKCKVVNGQEVCKRKGWILRQECR